jgi:hypothetical protein
MANYHEQVLHAWDEWELETKAESGDPDAFIAWAVAHKKLAPRPQDVASLLRRQITTVLCHAQRIDEKGVPYRAKQSVLLFEGGVAQRRWFDTDTGGTPNLRQKAVHQRREGIAHRVYRAMCDVEHMNHTFPEDPQLKFVLDFHDDYAEKKAAEALFDDEEDIEEIG